MSDLANYIAELLRDYDEIQRENAEIEKEEEDKIGAFAASIALKALGIDIPLGASVSRENITEAINTGVLGGQVRFSNLFDRDAVKADIKRIAIERAAAAFGYDSGGGIAGIKEKVIGDVLRKIASEVQAGAGDFVDAAPDSSYAQRVVANEKKEDWNTPSDFSKKGISNRARQATYRASHKRVWVPR